MAVFRDKYNIVLISSWEGRLKNTSWMSIRTIRVSKSMRIIKMAITNSYLDQNGNLFGSICITDITFGVIRLRSILKCVVF